MCVWVPPGVMRLQEVQLAWGPLLRRAEGERAEAGSRGDRAYRTKAVPQTQWDCTIVDWWGFTPLFSSLIIQGWI